MRPHIGIVLASLAALSLGVPAYADSLTGSQVTLTLDDPTLGTPISNSATATVGPGIEFPTGTLTSINPNYTLYNPNIDVSSESILLDYTINGIFNGAAFNGFVFDFSGAPTITGVSLDPSSVFPAGDVVGLTFTGDEIAVNLESATVTPTTSILLDVDTGSTVTPEPRSVVFLATGLLALFGLAQIKQLKPKKLAA